MDQVRYFDTTSLTDYLPELATYRIQLTPMSAQPLPSAPPSLNVGNVQFLPVVITDDSCECEISSKLGNSSRSVCLLAIICDDRRYRYDGAYITSGYPGFTCWLVISDYNTYHNLLDRSKLSFFF